VAAVSQIAAKCGRTWSSWVTFDWFSDY